MLVCKRQNILDYNMKRAFSVALVMYFSISGLCAFAQQSQTSSHDATNETEKVGNILFAGQDGNEIVLRDLRGKVVFINFWATWCLPCKIEMPGINKLRKSFADNPDIVFLTVDVENDLPNSVAYMKKKRFDLPVYAVKNGLPQGFLPNAIPVTIIINKKGIVVAKEVGAINYSKPSVRKYLDQLVKE